MVAATTSFAAPWWKRLLSAPHVSRAAFIDGAATAISKKPRNVWKVFSFLAMDIYRASSEPWNRANSAASP